MTDNNSKIDLGPLTKLRLVVARYGEMDSARWWNTGGLLGTKGALLMSRGFPRTHIFAQAGVVLAVARSRCAEVFQHPGATTLSGVCQQRSKTSSIPVGGVGWKNLILGATFSQN